jgi:hypothetical protein
MLRRNSQTHTTQRRFDADTTGGKDLGSEIVRLQITSSARRAPPSAKRIVKKLEILKPPVLINRYIFISDYIPHEYCKTYQPYHIIKLSR